MFRTQILTKPLYWLLVAALLLASITPVIMTRKTEAYALLTSRLIEMSSSQQAATSVTYHVEFDVATTATVKGIVVDFCSTTPIIGDSCTAPSSFSVGSPTVSGHVGISGGWTDAAANSNRTLTLTDSTGVAFIAGDPVAFDITTVTNPNTTNTTFYARILTYPNDSGANSPATYSDTAPGTSIDAGGIALSTANQITITAKVQERLTFCVYTGVNCAAGGSTVALGDTNGVLDFAGPYVDKNAKYDVATNASGNVAIRVKGDTLTSGGNTITAIGGSQAASSTGSEQFGFCTYQATGSGLTASSPYDHASCSTTTQTAGTGSTGGNGTAQFAFDTTNTNTTYGQTFASKVPGTTSQGILAFIGNISAATEAGIYTTTLTFIATGTY